MKTLEFEFSPDEWAEFKRRAKESRLPIGKATQRSFFIGVHLMALDEIRHLMMVNPPGTDLAKREIEIQEKIDQWSKYIEKTRTLWVHRG